MLSEAKSHPKMGTNDKIRVIVKCPCCNKFFVIELNISKSEDKNG
jgi:hypothetical protein